MPGRAELRATLISKTALAYTPSTFGLGGHHVGVALENVSNAPAQVGGLRVSFRATRAGVGYPCRPRIGPATGEREPQTLAPQERHVFERDLDCVLPLPGRYAVEVMISFEPTPGTVSVGTLQLDLEPRGGRLPVAHPALPGLWAMMVGDSNARPLKEEAWARGAYGVVLALVNASPQPLRLTGARVLFRVYKVGTSLPCMDEPVVLGGPAQLEPGVTYVERVPITCIMNKPGAYDIDSALLVGGDAREVVLGRTRLTVGPDPNLTFPPHVY